MIFLVLQSDREESTQAISRIGLNKHVFVSTKLADLTYFPEQQAYVGYL